MGGRLNRGAGNSGNHINSAWVSGNYANCERAGSNGAVARLNTTTKPS